MILLRIVALLLTAASVASCSPPSGAHWKQVGELGGSPYIRFVEVDAESAHDGTVYRDAATKLCGAGSDCWQVGIFLPADQVPPSGDKASFFNAGGWKDYAPAAVWSGDHFTSWDCKKAGAEDAPLDALCGKGVGEEFEAVEHLASRVGWIVGCHLPATKDRELVERFADRQSPRNRDLLMQEFDHMEKESESGPDDPADCQNLRVHIEDNARNARRALKAE